jgi:hypothetical protein
MSRLAASRSDGIMVRDGGESEIDTSLKKPYKQKAVEPEAPRLS